MILVILERNLPPTIWYWYFVFLSIIVDIIPHSQSVSIPTQNISRLVQFSSAVALIPLIIICSVFLSIFQVILRKTGHVSCIFVEFLTLYTKQPWQLNKVLTSSHFYRLMKTHKIIKMVPQIIIQKITQNRGIQIYK